MQTSLSRPVVAERVYEHACGLAIAGRVFTLQQLARHPDLSWRSHPTKRASQLLEPYRQSFELIPWQRTFLWRMTDKEKRRRGIQFRNVGASQHASHWLSLGDMWQQLVFNGLRPQKWFTEGNAIGRFDVFMVLRNTPYLVELQQTPLSQRQWVAKWHRRAEWLKLQRWRDEQWASRFCSVPPRILLVTTEPMDVIIPTGVIHVQKIGEIQRAIRKGYP